VSNVLTEQKQQQVLALGRLGWPLRRIQRETGVRRETASAYLKAAGIAVRPPGGWGKHAPESKPANGPNEVSTDFGGDFPAPLAANASETPAPKDAKADHEVSTGPAEPGRSATTSSACEPHRDFIELSLAKGRNARAIYQDLVDDHGFTGRYASVKRFVRRCRGTQTPEARAVILTQPGEEAQVDYGTGPLVRDPKTGGYRRTRLFVLTLGYSRKCVRLLTFQSNTRTWAELHEKAFRRLGGATKTVVLDNLREGVLKADIYDPVLNPLYRDVLAHYGAVALPCRAGDPDRKGKVERGVGHAKNTPLKGQRFESLEEAQAYLDRWEAHWADTRIHGTVKRQVATMFAEEKPALTPLALEPFRHYQVGERRVNLDGCVEVEAAYYSVPPGWIARSVKVQWDGRVVRVLDPRSGQLLREHLRQERGRYRIPDEDKPAKTPRTTAQLLARCARIGGHIGTLSERMYARGGQSEIRRILGITSLARKHGAALANDACAAALESGVPANPYRFVRLWLERRAPLTLRQVDPIIRQLTLYRDLIDQKTTQENEE
jgi:transposase